MANEVTGCQMNKHYWFNHFFMTSYESDVNCNYQIRILITDFLIWKHCWRSRSTIYNDIYSASSTWTPYTPKPRLALSLLPSLSPYWETSNLSKLHFLTVVSFFMVSNSCFHFVIIFYFILLSSPELWITTVILLIMSQLKG